MDHLTVDDYIDDVTLTSLLLISLQKKLAFHLDYLTFFLLNPDQNVQGNLHLK